MRSAVREGRERVPFATVGDSMAIQSAKAECDIRNIVSQYRKTGYVAHVASRTASFMDVPNVGDFEAALELVASASEAFLDLPSEIRKEFDNDPARLVAFMQDPANLDRARELGLIAPPVRPERASPSPEDLGASAPADDPGAE